MIELERLKEILQSNLLIHIYSDKADVNYNSIIKDIYTDTTIQNRTVNTTVMKENIFIKYQNQFYKIHGYNIKNGFLYSKTNFIPYEELGWLKKIHLKYKQKDIKKLTLKPCYDEEINLNSTTASLKRDLYKIFIKSNIMKSQIVYNTYYKELYEINYIEFKELPDRVSNISNQEEALFLAMVFERYYISTPFIDTGSLLLSIDSYSHEKIKRMIEENMTKRSKWAFDYGTDTLDLSEIKYLLGC
jgi:hypothetical protein